MHTECTGTASLRAKDRHTVRSAAKCMFERKFQQCSPALDSATAFAVNPDKMNRTARSGLVPGRGAGARSSASEERLG